MDWQRPGICVASTSPAIAMSIGLYQKYHHSITISSRSRILKLSLVALKHCQTGLHNVVHGNNIQPLFSLGKRLLIAQLNGGDRALRFHPRPPLHHHWTFPPQFLLLPRKTGQEQAENGGKTRRNIQDLSESLKIAWKQTSVSPIPSCTLVLSVWLQSLEDEIACHQGILYRMPGRFMQEDKQRLLAKAWAVCDKRGITMVSVCYVRYEIGRTTARNL